MATDRNLRNERKIVRVYLLACAQRSDKFSRHTIHTLHFSPTINVYVHFITLNSLHQCAQHTLMNTHLAHTNTQNAISMIFTNDCILHSIRAFLSFLFHIFSFSLLIVVAVRFNEAVTWQSTIWKTCWREQRLTRFMIRCSLLMQSVDKVTEAHSNSKISLKSLSL